ncbi:hypothetical protein C5Y96_26445 [Blastopirellula marina]|uniref:SLA1 homology domain-containing protein n=1 Tax=Blastopirellula marina TaxID=124 RepID=A0A2S8EYS6_9BACT|nr:MULTISPECIES: hypothetical protein [Pirellulaceae]PQO25047.1 hypothetical protein C5Y96_26445 [Blastopirellula marina]RCS40899.1 hypothetical protein DTL36_26495 [Bremerella cremea]
MGAIRTLIVCSLVWVGLCSSVRADETRTWVDTNGNQVPGELVEVTDDEMVVLRVGEEEVSIPLLVFSVQDRTYLHEQLPDKVKKPTEQEVQAAKKSTQSKPNNKKSKQQLTGADLYQPPRKNQNYYLEYYCSVCYGELSSKSGVGTVCPHCGSLIMGEEDEHGNLVRGSRPPWFANIPVRLIGFLVFMVVSTAWKFRRFIPVG